MKDLGVWGVRVENGHVYFTYRDHYIGQFMGSEYNARYMAVCINAALGCWSAIDDEVQAELSDAPEPRRYGNPPPTQRPVGRRLGDR